MTAMASDASPAPQSTTTTEGGMIIENDELKAGDHLQGQETVQVYDDSTMEIPAIAHYTTGGYENSVLSEISEGHFEDTDINDQVMGMSPIEDHGEDKYFVADSQNQMQHPVPGAGNSFAREGDEQHISEPLQVGGNGDLSITESGPLDNAADEIAMTSTAHGNMGELEVDFDGKDMTIQPEEGINTWYVLIRYYAAFVDLYEVAISMMTTLLYQIYPKTVSRIETLMIKL
jgi:hypothetical protein